MEQNIFDPSKKIETCPVCGAELENVFLDFEDCPVIIDPEAQTVTPYYITDQGNFILIDDEECPIVAHLIIDHAH